MNTLNQYSVNAVKTFTGREGLGYSCSLLLQGKKVAEVANDANGGELRFHWLDTNDVTTFNRRNYKGEVESHKGTQQESKFQEMVTGLPKISSDVNQKELTTNADIVLDDLVNDFLVIKKVKSDIKKSFTIQDTVSKIICWKITASHTVDILRKFALNKYPDAIVINDLPIEKIIEIYKKEKIII